MKKVSNSVNFTIGLILVLMFFVCCIPASALEPTKNYGVGKPKALDIYIGEYPYSSSIGGNITAGTKQEVPNEFKVIKDDEKIADPDWYESLGETPGPTETPTVAPTPTATAVIPIDPGGIGAQLCVMDDKSDIIVDFAYSSADYKNEFKLAGPKSISLGWSQGTMPNRVGTPFGATWNLGKFASGYELIFSSTANGRTYYTGPASRNPDNFIHAAISLKNSTGTHHKYLVTFEDYWGGGDEDYNDLEFYVSGDVSTACSGSGSPQDSGSGALVPVYVEGSVCKCSSEYKSGGKYTCVAQFTYNSTVNNLIIPVRGSSLPWNEFTGSGMVEQYRCQPQIFFVDSSPYKQDPFWTNRFWSNIKWKLGNTQSVLIKCQQNTPTCVSLYGNSDMCVDCKNNHIP
jgi:hypothetical protein